MGRPFSLALHLLYRCLYLLGRKTIRTIHLTANIVKEQNYTPEIDRLYERESQTFVATCASPCDAAFGDGLIGLTCQTAMDGRFPCSGGFCLTDDDRCRTTGEPTDN